MNEQTEGYSEYVGWRVRYNPQPADGDGLPRANTSVYGPTRGAHRRKNNRKEKWKRAADAAIIAVCVIGVIYGSIVSAIYWRW